MNYKFFTYNKNYEWGDSCVFMATTLEGGFLFRKNGSLTNLKLDYDFRTARALENSKFKYWKEVSLKEGLKLVSLEGRKIILDKLGLPAPESVVVNEKTKSLILELLEKNRAFNGDAAYDFEGIEEMQDSLESLVEQNIIKSVGNKFYIDK